MKTLLYTLIILSFSLPTIAQVGVNVDGSQADASAILDIKSIDKGMLVPRMDSTARKSILNPAIGLLVYDSTSTSFWYYDKQWNEIKNSTQKTSFNDFIDSTSINEYDCLRSIGNIATDNVLSLLTQEDYLFFTSSMNDSIQVYNVSNHKNPINHSSLSAINPTNLQLIGDYLYYSSRNNAGRFTAVDASDPKNLTELSFLNTGSELVEVVISGSYAYAIDDSGNFVIIDITNPLNIIEVFSGTLNLFGVKGIAVKNNYLYCYSWPLNTFYTIDVSNPLSPTIETNIPFTNSIGGSGKQEALIIGNHYYTFDRNGELRAFDISDPMNPSLESAFGVSGFRFFYTDSIFYVSNLGELDIYKVNGPTAFQFLANTVPGSSAYSLTTNENYIFVADWNEGKIQLVDNNCASVLSINPIDGRITQVNYPQLTLDDNLLGITESNNVDLSGINTDNQNLSFMQS